MLRRKTPLKARRGLSRRPVPTAAATNTINPRTSIPDDVRAALWDRSGGWCEMQLSGCQEGARDPSHRISRKSGGRHGAAAVEADRLSNLLYACRACHTWCHNNPREAYDLGLTLRQFQNPLTEPALYRGELMFLDDDGGVRRWEGRWEVPAA